MAENSMKKAEEMINRAEETKTLFSPEERNLIVNYAYQTNDLKKTEQLLNQLAAEGYGLRYGYQDIGIKAAVDKEIEEGKVSWVEDAKKMLKDAEKMQEPLSSEEKNLILNYAYHTQNSDNVASLIHRLPDQEIMDEVKNEIIETTYQMQQQIEDSGYKPTETLLKGINDFNNLSRQNLNLSEILDIDGEVGELPKEQMKTLERIVSECQEQNTEKSIAGNIPDSPEQLFSKFESRLSELEGSIADCENSIKELESQVSENQKNLLSFEKMMNPDHAHQHDPKEPKASKKLFTEEKGGLSKKLDDITWNLMSTNEKVTNKSQLRTGPEL